MFINDLHLKNFKGISELNLKFAKLNLVEGGNARGKTSIIEALCYILTDYLEERIKEYIRWDSDESTLETNFTIDHNKFQSKISLTENRASKELTINDDKDEIYYNSQASKKLAEFIDPVLTLYSSISLQHKSTGILFETASARLLKLKSILGMDKIVEVSETMFNDIKAKKESIEKLKTEIFVLEGIVYELLTIQDLEDITDLKKNFELVTLKYERYQSDKRNYDQYISLLKDYEKLEKQKLTWENELKILNENLVKYKANYKEINVAELANYKDRLSQIINEETIYNNQLKAYNIYLNQIKKKDLLLLNIKKAKESIKRLPYSQTKNEENQQDLIKNKVLIEKCKTDLQLIKEGKCPTCGKDFHGDENDVAKLIESLESTNKNLASKIQLFQEIQSLNDKALSEIEHLQHFVDEFNIVEESEPEIKDFVNIKKELNDNINSISIIEENNKKVERQIRDYENSILKVSTQLSTIVLNKPELVLKPDEYVELEFEELKNKILIWEEKEKQYLEAIKFNNEIKIKDQKRKDDIVSKTKELESEHFQLKIIEQSRSILDKEFSSYLLEKGLGLIEKEINSFFQRNSKYKVFLKKEGKSVDFFYSPDGEKMSSVGVASGFEKQLLAIAFRIALCSLQNLGILILDEIDESAEEVNSLELYKNILELQDKFDQIFIITHKPDTIDFLVNEYGANKISL